MQRTKPKISLRKLQAEIVGWEHVWGKYMLFLGNNFEIEEVRNITESLGSFGLQRQPCRERKPKSAKRDSNCGKINSENKRGSAAKIYQAKIVSRQTGWENAAVSFRKQIEKQADMKHSRKSRQFRSRKISPQKAKFKICEEKPDLQEIIHFGTRGGNLVINLPKIEHEYREESYDSAIFFLFSLPCFC